LDSNIEGFESTGFDIPLYASLLTSMQHFKFCSHKKSVQYERIGIGHTFSIHIPQQWWNQQIFDTHNFQVKSIDPFSTKIITTNFHLKHI